MSDISWIVLKFGGTSVRDSNCWQRIQHILHQKLAQGLHPFLVLSAPRGVSDSLAKIVAAAEILPSEIEYLKKTYQDLAADLSVDALIDWPKFFVRLDKTISALFVDSHPGKIKAEIMACGELLVSKVADLYLQRQGFKSLYLDARDFLFSNIDDPNNIEQYLKSYCSYEPDITLQNYLLNNNVQVVVTQGFIAANPQGHTILLGRGGSDTSAAYFAAKLQSVACEIWTDVAGIYTANPNLIPEARLLPKLDYDEAQEIALTGGKVLHPESLAPVKRYNIPMQIKSSYLPESEGTTITNDISYKTSSIKSIISRKGVVLIEMTTFSMWKQAGFLAKVFSIFQMYNVSVDLIATAEMNVTVTLDKSQQHCDSELLLKLLADLQQFCEAKLITSCATISLVGRHMRSILYKLAAIFNLISEHQVYLISQAANDLNFSFVVDERLADRLVQRLHHLLLENTEANEYVNDKDRSLQQSMLYHQNDWWVNKSKILLQLMAARKEAQYVYDLDTCSKQINCLLEVDAVNKSFYAVKANHCPEILKLIFQCGLGFECVSLAEVDFVFNLFPDIDPKRIIYTPNYVTGEEYERAFALSVIVILDAIQPINLWPEVFRGKAILLRVDPGVGTGHQRFVSTGGLESKFGMTLDQVSTLR